MWYTKPDRADFNAIHILLRILTFGDDAMHRAVMSD